MPEMTENETPSKKQHRKKNRETHNAVERHRKKKINAGINRIGELIPCSPALKQLNARRGVSEGAVIQDSWVLVPALPLTSKNMILDQAFKYITEMKRQNDELLLNGGNSEQAEEIKKLRKQLDELQKENGRYIELLKANDICLYDDPTIHWKGNLKNAKVSVVIPSDQVQKNIIVYSNGSQPSGNNQGTPVQGITFNVGNNLQKQTANVVPVQRTCNLVSPVTISGICPTENKPWSQTTVSPLASNQPVPAGNLVELSTSDNEQALLSSATANLQKASHSGTEPELYCSSSNMSQNDQNVPQAKHGQESTKLTKKTVTPGIILPPNATIEASQIQQVNVSYSRLQDSRSEFQESFVVSATATTCTPSVRLSIMDGSPSVNVLKSTDLGSSAGMPVTSAVGVKALTTISTLPASSLDNCWSFSGSSSVGASDLKNMSNLTWIPSVGNTQTTWTTLQLAGNTVQPLSQTPSGLMTALLNEPVTSAHSVSSTSNRHLTSSMSLNPSLTGDRQAAEQIVVTMPSCPSLPVQPLITQPQVKAQPAGNILPLNSAMQVIQMAQPVGGSAVTAAPANQNVIILQPPNTTPCPPIVRAEVSSQTVSQQIVIIQTANQNPLPLLSAQAPGSVRVPVNGPSSITNSNNLVQNASAPQTFGGKHLVHILPRPSSLPSSSSTQTFSVTMSNQQHPQTISLNGQLFALQPVMSSSGTSNQTPMQIIQPTTSEDPNTNVALNTFGALANLNQSISQMAGQSCLQLPLSQPTNPTVANSQIAPINCVPLPTSISSIATESSTVLPSAAHSVSTSPKKPASVPSNVKSKRTNKKQSTKKHLISISKNSCPAVPCRDVGKLDCTNVEGTDQCSNSEGLRKNKSVLSQTLDVSQAKSMAALSPESISDDCSKEAHNSEQMMGSGHLPEPSSTETPTSSPLKSVMSEQFALVQSSSKNSIPQQAWRPQNNPLPNSALLELSKSNATPTVSMSSPCEAHVTISQIPETPRAQSSATNHPSETEAISETCSIGQNSSIGVQGTDLLEGQGLTKMLSDLTKERTAGQKTSFAVHVEHSNFPTENSKTIEANVSLPEKQELLLMNTEGDTLTQHHSCISDQEVVNSSLIASRQADSPMSTSSGSSHSFSVASMLPDTSKEDVTSSTSTNSYSSCTFSEQTDIVALAARAIFDQENLEKGGGGVQVNIRDKSAEIAPLEREQQSFKLQPPKENNAGQLEISPSKFSAQDSVQTNIERPAEKPSCSVGVEISNTLQISTSHSPSVTSLSVNNLIHQSCIIQPLVSCSGLSQPSEQTPVPATVNLSISSSSYVSPSPGPAMVTEYAQEQLNAIRANPMQASQIQEPHLKQQTHESLKDAAKRVVQDDFLLSTAKRQKQCQTTPIRLEGMVLMNRTPDGIADQSQMLVSQMPPSSSNPVVSVSNQGHTDGLNRLFPSANSFVTTVRQTEVQCSSQPSISEQQSQTGGQHLQSIQHVPAPGISHIHNNHPYLKQQQAGQLRERHHLYQMQHHIPHAESSVHLQPHSVHQQRTIQQEVQMQKKRSLVQGTQTTQLSLQQKHHGSDQSRQKNGQPHPHHQQMQQQLQQHFGNSHPEKNCENPATSRNHHNHPQSHINQDILHQQQDVGSRQQASGVSSEHVSGHNQMQRLMTSRGLEQQMVSQPSAVTRPSDMTCAPHRQERNRVSSYSAEALIGKTPSNSEQRIGMPLQGPRVSDQLEMRSYLDVSRNKGLVIHNMQGRISIDHVVGSDVQRLSDCQPFKPGGASQQSAGNFDVQASRNSDIGNSVSSLRGMQSQVFRISQNTVQPIERQKRLPYQPVQGIPTGNALLPRDNENTCHQSFMQSLLAPHLGDQVTGSQRSISEHQRNTQCGASSTIEYNCPPTRESVHIRRDGEAQNRESCDLSMGTINTRNNSLNIPFSSSSSSGDIQGRNTSPNISVQKSNPMRMTDTHGTKSHMNTPVSSNLHGVVRPALPHPAASHGNAEQGQPPVRQPNSSVTQRSRHPLHDNNGSKIRQPERNRSGNQRHGNVFDPSLPHLPLSTSGSVILGRQQSTVEKRGSIVRFMSDSPQVSNDNAVPDQHTLSQNFGFPFIPEGGMNPPINANTSFIPPVTQPSATRTPALIPVDPQNTLPSFYPPYSPAHPTLSNDISIPYFPNQMFPNPSTEKPSSGGLNNRFGSILSPPRPVGFAQPSFPLLPDMPPMHMTNTSHLSNFNLTSLFPEIATALPPDGSAMSPLLSIANTSASDSSKQSSNRPAHNISHILGHDCSSAV
ncbi:basic helix-loop-helix domain-containing protein USF3 isoform X2 [Alligator mississippiensis]|nr:basic helix-loop-helix domain-containing protein USF3 isoform X2 [Alligator mississippiensis]XP_019351726.1 basic helix-loop-helix domain-containing protein USF3 isoform X2 [Alligator mississippiensis]XP_059576329.1 basic helix-loop-helix domain-containing protein USF3 isoform X2 [Alligator mississippiensis]XP_059576330.1 basic helix-loop-helix domain-containing protein USF3 isoform X2 [Alligator mississippiensis]